jgi:RNA polymerase sigma factor (sigma-70 family)
MMARRLLHTESHAHSFTPTALAMTALRRAKLKAQDWETVRWENRAHFFSALCVAMRHALVDRARKRSARGREHILYFPPDENLFRDLPADTEDKPARVILLEEALARLETEDKRLSEVVHQFYFMSYSVSEIAGFNGVSEKTVDRDLKKARIVLRRLLEDLQAAA